MIEMLFTKVLNISSFYYNDLIGLGLTLCRYVPGGNRIGVSFSFHIQCVAWNPFAITTIYAWQYSGLLPTDFMLLVIMKPTFSNLYLIIVNPVD